MFNLVQTIHREHETSMIGDDWSRGKSNWVRRVAAGQSEFS